MPISSVDPTSPPQSTLLECVLSDWWRCRESHPGPVRRRHASTLHYIYNMVILACQLIIFRIDYILDAKARYHSLATSAGACQAIHPILAPRNIGTLDTENIKITLRELFLRYEPQCILDCINLRMQEDLSFTVSIFRHHNWMRLVLINSRCYEMLTINNTCTHLESSLYSWILDRKACEHFLYLVVHCITSEPSCV